MAHGAVAQVRYYTCPCHSDESFTLPFGVVILLRYVRFYFLEKSFPKLPFKVRSQHETLTVVHNLTTFPPKNCVRLRLYFSAYYSDCRTPTVISILSFQNKGERGLERRERIRYFVISGVVFFNQPYT